MSDFIGTKLTMNLGERSYDIILKNGALENLYQFARLDRKVAAAFRPSTPSVSRISAAMPSSSPCRRAKPARASKFWKRC